MLNVSIIIIFLPDVPFATEISEERNAHTPLAALSRGVLGTQSPLVKWSGRRMLTWVSEGTKFDWDLQTLQRDLKPRVGPTCHSSWYSGDRGRWIVNSWIAWAARQELV